jgi:hypothetical protein
MARRIALDVRGDAAEVVGAEASGQRGETRMGRLFGEGLVKVFGIAEENANEVKGDGDAAAVWSYRFWCKADRCKLLKFADKSDPSTSNRGQFQKLSYPRPYRYFLYF